jgi:hypothetical protein
MSLAIFSRLSTIRPKSRDNFLMTSRRLRQNKATQQARYFKAESDLHEDLAKRWRTWTIATAVVLVIYAAVSAVVHKVDYIRPDNAYETAQLIVSKVLIFVVIAFVLALSARNFLSHTHNSIVNRHRQNALLTFQTLADSTRSDASKDVVLQHASACIFTPQETGYVRPGKSDGPTIVSSPIVDLVGRATMRGEATN